MLKYKVVFSKQRQIDGWTDPANDLEFDTVSETITVEANNQEHAKMVAVRKSTGWMTYTYPRLVRWTKDDVKSVKRKVTESR